MDALALNEKIYSNFPAEIPSDRDFWQENSIEGQKVKAFFLGKSWTQINLSSLNDGYQGDASACLSFMQESGAAYYFPAFLSIILNDYLKSDMIFEGMMYEFSDVLSTHESELQKAIKKFDNEKKLVIHDVLEYLLSIHEGGDILISQTLPMFKKVYLSI